MTNSEPLPGASFGQAVSRFFRGYVRFSGRASRSEFWWMVFFEVLLGIVLTAAQFVSLMIEGLNTPKDAPTTMADSLSYSTFSWLQFFIALAILLPWIAVTVRRLHDANLSGWYVLLCLTGIGGLVVLVMSLLPSKPEGARFDEKTESA